MTTKPGPIEAAINRTRTPRTAREVRHRMIVDHARANLPDSWTEAGVTFLVTQPPRVSPDGFVELNVLATDARGVLLPGMDNPYQFENPPFIVPSTTGGLRENAAESLRLLVSAVIRAQATAAGWTEG